MCQVLVNYMCFNTIAVALIEIVSVAIKLVFGK